MLLVSCEGPGRTFSIQCSVFSVQCAQYRYTQCSVYSVHSTGTLVTFHDRPSYFPPLLQTFALVALCLPAINQQMYCIYKTVIDETSFVRSSSIRCTDALVLLQSGRLTSKWSKYLFIVRSMFAFHVVSFFRIA